MARNLALAVLFAAQPAASKLSFRDDGTFKILHLSDVHYHIFANGSENGGCRDIKDSRLPCTADNTTDFIQRLIAVEQPDLIVHTGDVIDGSSKPASVSMDALYGLSVAAGKPWAATLGNHDDNSDLNRSEVMSYIMGLEGTLSQVNELGPGPQAVTESYGNFVLDIFKTNDPTPAFRTFHLDSSTNDAPVNEEQVAWFNATVEGYAAAGTRTPALLFTHLPLMEYWQATASKDFCGSIHEHISSETVNSGLFSALLADGSVKATFVGHDHTNDFCGGVQGVQLCYEGSPGYQGYSTCQNLPLGPRQGECFQRRARVTEVSGFGAAVKSWKRVDAAPWPTEQVVDVQTLWSAGVTAVAGEKTMVSGSSGYDGSGASCSRKQVHFSLEDIKALPRLAQN